MCCYVPYSRAGLIPDKAGEAEMAIHVPRSPDRARASRCVSAPKLLTSRDRTAIVLRPYPRHGTRPPYGRNVDSSHSAPGSWSQAPSNVRVRCMHVPAGPSHFTWPGMAGSSGAKAPAAARVSVHVPARDEGGGQVRGRVSCSTLELFFPCVFNGAVAFWNSGVRAS